MNLTAFARVNLTPAPTPLHPLTNLSRLLGGPNIWIKRDDLTGLAFGGNKTRKLEFLIGDALSRGATHILTQGATQSNHVRQTIAAANLFNLKTSVLLEERVSGAPQDYYSNGNVLLDQILDATIDTRPSGLDMNQELVPLAETLKAQGHSPYIIPGGGSNPIGSLGYVVTAQEIVHQANAQQLVIDHLVHATGSTGTQAGLVVGLEGQNAHIPVLGFSVRAPKERQEENVRKLARQTWELLGLRGDFPEESVAANSDYVGQGYGHTTEAMVEAIELLARSEGIFLDPVYSGKAFAGLIDYVRKGIFKKGQNIVFVHTGGAVGLFAYKSSFSKQSS